MRYGNVCTGIGAPEVAWASLGWTPMWFSEIAPFPCRILDHYFGSIPNLGDMLKLEQNEVFQKSVIHLLVGGTPCQSFSTAGLRAGLASVNGNLAIEFCRILAIKRTRWFIWENVPGVHSSYSYEEGSSRMDREGRTDGRDFTETADFASILQGFSISGYSVAWRVLDAQFFGVPQRRRRVFVVGYLGNDWRPPAAVLFEPEGLRGHPSKGRKKGEEITGPIGKRTGGRSIGADEAGGNMLIAGTIDASYGRLQGASSQDSCHGHSTLVFGGNNLAGPIDVATAVNASKSSYGRLDFESETFVATLNKTSSRLGGVSGQCVSLEPRVRRLTPLECERLQGFPDNYTAIPGAADSLRYEAIGNSMAVPVMAWIGRRIDHMDKYLQSR